jgi:hypothetical protein
MAGAISTKPASVSRWAQPHGACEQGGQYSWIHTLKSSAGAISTRPATLSGWASARCRASQPPRELPASRARALLSKCDGDDDGGGGHHDGHHDAAVYPLPTPCRREWPSRGRYCSPNRAVTARQAVLVFWAFPKPIWAFHVGHTTRDADTHTYA